jgi:hypothetical protein
MPFKVYTYPKFGDHCIAFGIIKEFAKQHDTVYMYTDESPQSTRDTNRRLYSSIKNVELIDEPYVEEKHQRDWGLANTKPWIDAVKPWAEDPLLPAPDWYDDSWRFDVQWYMNASVPFHLKWDNFYFERDIKKEQEVYYDILGLKHNEEFIFWHEDLSRGYKLKRDNVPTDIRWIHFSDIQEVNILDILYTVERAKEIHTFNTGLAALIDLSQIYHPALFFHKYIRPMIFDQPILKLNWRIIE